jgi:ribosomal protein L11 methylase PrmA
VIFLAAVALIILQTILNGISPMPSTNKVRSEMLRLICDLDTPHKIIDLGSGWGNLSFAFARKFSLAKVIGYENSLVPYLFSVCLNCIFKYNNLQFHFYNFFKISFNDADLIVCYLFPGAMKLLEQKFQQELKPGAVVVTNTFALPNKKPFNVIQVNDFYRTKIYLYVF